MTALRKITNTLWEITSDFKLGGGVYFPLRTTIVGLDSGDLWVHSPGPATKSTFEHIREIGDVRYIVAPNLFHHLFVADFAAAFPEAQIWGAPGLSEKQKK